MTYRKSMSDAIREVQESTIKPYISMSMGGQYNVLDKNSKVVYSTRNKTLAYDYFKKNFDKLKEDGDHEVSMAIGQLKTISQYAEKLQTILQSKGNDYDIEAWVQSKITSAEDYMNSVGHYMENDPSVSEEVNEVSDKLKLAVLKKKIKQYKDKVFKKTMSTIKSPLFAGYEEVEEGRMKDIFTADQEGKSAEEIAKIMKLPLKTVKGILGEEVFGEISEFTSDMIKRLQKSYSTMPKTISPEQAKALSKHLDRLDLASLKQLTKANIPFVTTLARNKVYKKTGKFEELEEITIKKVDGEKGFDYKGQFITDPTSDPSGRFEVDPKKYYKLTDKQLKDLKESDINVDNVKKDDSEKEKELKIKLDKEKDQDALEKQLIAAQGQINILKQKLENEKNKAIKPEPNPKTGEVPLTVGVAYKHFKNEKEKEEVKEGRYEVSGTVTYQGVSGEDEVTVVVDAMDKMDAEDVADEMIDDLRRKRKIGPKRGGQVKRFDPFDIEYTRKKEGLVDKMMENVSKAERDKRIQRAKDMIKYYDAQKKAALKGKNKDLAKKMLKNDINEATVVSDISGISIPALKRETAKFNIKVARVTPGGPNGAEYEVTFTGAEKDLVAYAKEHFGFDDKPGSFQQLKKHLNMDYVPEEMKKDDAYAIGMAQAKKSMNDEPPLDKKTITKGHKIAKKILNKEEKRVYVESMAGLKKKSDKSGMPYSILKKVFDRGMAAWKSGHRPGASQQQWAYARVNSFITKSSGTWGGADKDLAKQVKG